MRLSHHYFHCYFWDVSEFSPLYVHNYNFILVFLTRYRVHISKDIQLFFPLRSEVFFEVFLSFLSSALIGLAFSLKP